MPSQKTKSNIIILKIHSVKPEFVVSGSFRYYKYMYLYACVCVCVK